MNSKLIGIIPAAGLGTRMRSLTRELPKALIEIEGQSLLERAIQSLKSIGASKVVIVTGHRGDMIQELVGRRDLGVPIEFAFQPMQLGLTHALWVARDRITSHFVLLCPDNIFSDPEDLQEARNIFFTHKPDLLMIATVNPTHQRDRAKYFTSSLRQVAPHVYDYLKTNESQQGMALTSTGCTFFAYEALQLLPSFDNITTEQKFEKFVDAVAERDQSMLYLLRGTRNDLSEPEDVAAYLETRQALGNTRGQGVSAILLNPQGEVLLQHRDDNPNIRYPGHWGLFGGSIEEGEVPYAAARREILEEIGYEIETLGLFREFVQNNKREFAFIGEVGPSLLNLALREGQSMDFVSPADLSKLLIRPDDRETLNSYFGELDDRKS
jgi:NDP-sugar pyrophosphorylase family protein